MRRLERDSVFEPGPTHTLPGRVGGPQEPQPCECDHIHNNTGPAAGRRWLRTSGFWSCRNKLAIANSAGRMSDCPGLRTPGPQDSEPRRPRATCARRIFDFPIDTPRSTWYAENAWGTVCPSGNEKLKSGRGPEPQAGYPPRRITDYSYISQSQDPGRRWHPLRYQGAMRR